LSISLSDKAVADSWKLHIASIFNEINCRSNFLKNTLKWFVPEVQQTINDGKTDLKLNTAFFF
jgi:hypothetical protein